MRTNINLASQPYEDARRFMIAWSSVVGVLLLLVIVLSIGVGKRWQQYRQMSKNLNAERQILQDLDNKQRQGLAILNQPDNRDVREKSEFINSLIRRKQVSWTTIFTDLELLMPPHLHVIGVAPVIKDDKIMVEMVLGGDRDRALELARRMEQSNVFRDALVDTESAEQAQPGQQGQDLWHFRISAEYMPGQALHKPSTEKQEAGGAD